jgi:Uncharacterised protein family (UPF0236)
MTVLEQTFRHGRSGPSLRPFVVSAAVPCRSYSQLLQRAITDFGADVPFAHIPKKLKEHYGIEVAVSSAQQITEKHGAALLQSQSLETEIPDRPGVGWLVAQLDGCMIPIVTTAEPTPDPSLDRRKIRQLDWREARLALAHPLGSVTPVWGATLGTPDQAGQHWAHCVVRAGAGTQTRIHCVGDGASWIAEQMERRFGTQAHYLIDFSHLSGYLSGAADCCAPAHQTAWLEQQQQHLKENQSDAVLDALAPFLEREKTVRGETPVQACYRYIHNRPGQFDYQSALAAGLPIGSGEVESGHRYVIQDRLKIVGAWWKEANAEKMLALRVCRANNDWEAYWQNRDQKAA